MPNLFSDHTVALAGYGFSVDGPYLTINDLDEGTVGYVPVLGRTFSLRRCRAGAASAASTFERTSGARAR